MVIPKSAPPVDGVKTAVIVEGPMDALAAAGEGMWAIALMGSMPGRDVLGHLAYRLREWNAGRVLCVADSDGPAFMVGVISYLTGQGIGAKLVVCSPTKDLAAATKAQRRSILQLP